VIDLIELAVGAVCLVAAVATWRRGTKVVSALLAVAGLAAVIHAIWSMTTT
jgi:hypothetical protein